jgi:phosphatidylglycerophosphate synthase
MQLALRKEQIPWTMASGRAAMAPLLIVGQRAGWNGITLACLVIAALLSDIFDGVLARRWKCDTAGVRLFDSMADIVFYLGCGVALWLRLPQLLRSFAWPLGLVAGLEVMRLAFDFAKFGKPASYHSYLAKTWGLVLASAVVVTFASSNSTGLALSAFWWTTSALGFACELEGLAMSLLLNVWRKDVKTLSQALRMRTEILSEKPEATGELAVPPRSQQRRSKLLIAQAGAKALVIAAILSIAAAAKADAIKGVTFTGGSVSSIPSDTAGTLQIDSPDKLIFQAASGNQIAIPYSAVESFYYRKELAHHLGVLPAIAVGLVSTRAHRRLITISYLDEAHAKQIVVLELPNGAPEILLPVLRSRTPFCQTQPRAFCGGKVQ